MTRPKILLNLFHPNLETSRANRVLVERVKDLPNLTYRDLYSVYRGVSGALDVTLNVKEEQQLLLQHDLIVFQHPFYWYSSPALLKEWEDRVLEMGFAYPPGAGDQLKGKHWLTVVTTGGGAQAYRSGGFNNFTISELLRPFQQTANLCGMKWIPPLVQHGVLPPGISGFKSVSDEEIADFADLYREYLSTYEI